MIHLCLLGWRQRREGKHCAVNHILYDFIFINISDIKYQLGRSYPLKKFEAELEHKIW